MKTSAEARARRLFAATLLVAAFAAAAWYLLAGTRYRTYEIRTGDPVSGLVAGAPVEFHGVEVGKVHAVDLLQPRLVRVLLDVRRDVPVSSATVATITGRGLAARGFTGYVYVNMEDTGAAGHPLVAAAGSPYPVLASAPSQTVSLDTSISRLNDSVQTVSGMLEAALDPRTVASLKQSLASMEQVTHTLAANNRRMEAIIANAERASGQMQPLLQSSMDSVRTLRTEVLPQARSALADIDGLSHAMNERMGAILQNTEQASTRFGPLLQSSSEAVRSLQTQILPEAHRTLTHLDQLSGSMGDTANRIRRNPSLLLRGSAGNAPGPGEAQ